jgi:tetratricopeptide (TPR) repeat protein
MNTIRSLRWNHRRWFLGVAWLACGLLLKPVQDSVDANRDADPSDPDALYFSSPSVIKALSLGYDSLVADVYWMRAIQYYGRRDEAERRQIKYKNLPALLDIVTTLDPKMVDVYRAGSTFLGEPDPVGAGQPREAIRLLDKGIAQLPEEWRLYFTKGFVYYWHLQDYRQAGQVWLDASRLATSPPWLEALAAQSMSRGGALETAKSLWRRQLEGAGREDLRVNAKNHLDSIQADEDIWTLEYFVQIYASVRGSKPAKLEGLVDSGLVRYVPKDPSGVAYQYDASSGKISLSPDSKVRYLTSPYDYRNEFIEKLARWYDSTRGR